MKKEVILATTHIDRRNEQLSKQALDSLAIHINKDEAAIPCTIEHDSTIPPIGKVLRAEVQKREDGEYQVLAVQETFDEVEWITTMNGESFFKQQSKEDRRPFANRGNGMSTNVVCIDQHNFESESDIKKFLEEIHVESDVDFTHQMFGRKSLIPDPEIIIGLVSFSKVIAAYWVVKKTKLGEKIEEITAEEIDKFYKFTRAVVFKGIKYLRPKNRPQTYVFVVSTVPSIEFVAVTNEADKLISAISIEKFQEALKKTSTLADHFTISKIQYLLDENGDWKFNFLLTNSGEVIGTEESLSRRAKRIELLENHRTTKKLVDKSVKNFLNKIRK